MKNLKKIRLNRGMTQQHLASLIGISVFTVSKYEVKAPNMFNPRISTILKFMKVLKCSFEDLCL